MRQGCYNLKPPLIMQCSITNLCFPYFAEEVCYGELGCFSNGYPYTSSLRPIPYLPWSPGNISTEFWLYTRCRQNVFKNLQL